MKLKALTPAQLDEIVHTLRRLTPTFIYLFGSAQRGALRSESDVDVAFYSLTPTDPLLLLEVTEVLAAKLSRDVDLIDLSEANDVIRAQVIGLGEVLNAQDLQILYERQIRWLKQYVMLNRERRPIIERIKREGSVYG